VSHTWTRGRVCISQAWIKVIHFTRESKREIWRKTVERKMAERHYKKRKSQRNIKLWLGKSFRNRVNIRKAFQRWRDQRGKTWKWTPRLLFLLRNWVTLGLLFHWTKICCCCNVSCSNRTVWWVFVRLELLCSWFYLLCLFFCSSLLFVHNLRFFSMKHYKST